MDTHQARISACNETLVDDVFVTTSATTGVCLFVAFCFGLYMASRYWNRWWNQLVVAAFNSADFDGSNSIDENELYSAVLTLYVMLPVKVRPPPRDEIMIMMEQLDSDQSGQIDFDEV